MGFALLNAAFFILLSSRYMALMAWPETPLSWLYLLSMTLGHFALLAFLPGLLILLPIWLLVPRSRHLLPFAVLLYALALSFLVIDTLVFAQYRFHLSPFYFKMLIEGGGQVIGFPAQTWALAVSGLVLIGLLEGFSAAMLWKHLDRAAEGMRGLGFSARKIGVVLFLLLLGSHLIHIWADAQYDRSVKTLTRYYPLLYPATAQKFMRRRGWAASPSERKARLLEARQTGARGELDYPKVPLRCRPSAQKHNLLMIVVDSWRYDAMTTEITPNISAFSRRSIRYENHFSGGNATRVGIFSLFYGLPGTYWQAVEGSQRGPVLLEHFLKNGYRTGIFASAPLNHPEFDRTVFADIPDLPIKTPGRTTHARDREITHRWRRWLDENGPEKSGSPFFGFLFFDSLHGYQYPEDYPRHFQPAWEEANYLELGPNTDPKPFRNLYNNIAHFEDSLVGELLDDLQARELLEETIVLITGDHGQEFNDNGKNYWGHNSNFSRYQTQVPFILHWPDRPPAVLRTRSSHMDVAPTILSTLFRCTNPPESYSVGRNLFAPEARPLTALLMASYSSFGVFDFAAGEITVKNGLGFYDLYDTHYNEIPEAKGGAGVLLQAIEQMSRFYR